MKVEEAIDVAIVGMGPAGLYTAWRLAKCEGDQRVLGRSAGDLKVALYDTMSADRVGGRLCSKPLPGFPFIAELGGMRYRSTQRLVSSMVQALGLANTVQSFSFPQQFYFLRGKRLTERQIKSRGAGANRYWLEADERGKLPHELIEQAIIEVLRSLDFGIRFHEASEPNAWAVRADALKEKIRSQNGLKGLTAKEWAVIKRFGEYRKATHLADVGFWDLLQFQLSPEAWHLAHDGLGYESIMGNWNAAVALPWFIADFATAEALTLSGGMSSIPRAMYEQVSKNPRFSTNHDWDLTGVDIIKSEDSDELIELTFTDPQRKITKVIARSAVLALPKGALIRLQYGDRLVSRARKPARAPENLDKRAWFLDLLNSVDGRPLFKLFLGYSSPWWASGESSIVTGKVNTDLPLRQVYYYGKDQWSGARVHDLGIDGGSAFSMVMASYSDSHYIEFWSELAKDPGHAFYGGSGGVAKLSGSDRAVWETFGAPRSMVIRAEHQLGLLHGRQVLYSDTEPRADVGLYMEWSRPPYYAGWHSWKVGVQPWLKIRLITQPFEGAGVFICGEAYSEEQGWTEGALKSAERLMETVFKLPAPKEIMDSFGSDEQALRDYIDVLEY